MGLFKKKRVKLVDLDPNKLDEIELRVFVALMDTIKAEAERTAQEFRALRENKNKYMNDTFVLGYDERKIHELIAKLNSFRKNLAEANQRALDMVVMLDRATH